MGELQHVGREGEQALSSNPHSFVPQMFTELVLCAGTILGTGMNEGTKQNTISARMDVIFY